MPAGRPPTYDLVQQTNDLREWSKKDNATALCQFCVQQDIYADIIYEWRDRCPEFASELKKARMRIAARLRQKLHDKEFPYNYGLFMAELGAHDKFHHDYQESIKDKDAARKKDIISATPQSVVVHVNKDLGCGLDVSATTLPNPSNQSVK